MTVSTYSVRFCTFIDLAEQKDEEKNPIWFIFKKALFSSKCAGYQRNRALTEIKMFFFVSDLKRF